MEETAASSSKRLKTNYSVDNLKINDTYIQHESKLSEAFCLRKPVKLGILNYIFIYIQYIRIQIFRYFSVRQTPIV